MPRSESNSGMTARTNGPAGLAADELIYVAPTVAALEFPCQSNRSEKNHDRDRESEVSYGVPASW